MRSLRLFPSLALGLGIFAFAGVASAHPTGEPGSSGKGGGGTCTGCHDPSGTPPTFDISLPETVAANDSVAVTVKVNGNQSLTAFDAAFDVDAIVTPGGGARGGNSASEVVSSTPMSGATGTWTFMVKVPNRNGILSLWVAGMSANGDGKNTGDATGTTVVTAVIAGGPDGGASTPPVDTTDTTDTSNGAATAAPDAGPPVIIPHPILPDGDPGCQLAPGHAPDVLALAGFGVVLLGLRRRSSRRGQPL